MSLLLLSSTACAVGEDIEDWDEDELEIDEDFDDGDRAVKQVECGDPGAELCVQNDGCQLLSVDAWLWAYYDSPSPIDFYADACDGELIASANETANYYSSWGLVYGGPTTVGIRSDSPVRIFPQIWGAHSWFSVQWFFPSF